LTIDRRRFLDPRFAEENPSLIFLLDDGIEPSLAHCRAERIVVALGLIGVCDGKISDGLIEAARPRIQCRAAPKAASARTAAV
jgi:hypothetical protein